LSRFGTFPHGLRDLVYPVVLGGPAHEEQVPVDELYAPEEILLDLAPELEPTGAAEAHRADDRALAELRFVIAVPRHAVLTGPETGLAGC
jgi:hypothetical protein